MASVTKQTYHATEAAAREAGELYMREYHPAGYGTTVKVWFDSDNVRWVLSSYRYSSCD